jgi:hypothetical protein
MRTRARVRVRRPACRGLTTAAFCVIPSGALRRSAESRDPFDSLRLLRAGSGGLGQSAGQRAKPQILRLARCARSLRMTFRLGCHGQPVVMSSRPLPPPTHPQKPALLYAGAPIHRVFLREEGVYRAGAGVPSAISRANVLVLFVIYWCLGGEYGWQVAASV